MAGLDNNEDAELRAALLAFNQSTPSANPTIGAAAGTTAANSAVLPTTTASQTVGFPSIAPATSATAATAIPAATTAPASTTTPAIAAAPSTTTPASTRSARMSEPRVRPSRQHGQMNFPNELRQMLHGYGDPTPHGAFPQEPHPETVRTLDAIVTDFIIESCHAAARTAAHAGRQKVKAEDFHYALRSDPTKLGRVQELFNIERELKEARKQFNENDDRLAGLKEMEKQTQDDEGNKEDAAEESTGTPAGEKPGKPKSKGKGRPKKAEKKAGRRR